MKYSKDALILYRQQNKITQGEMAKLIGVSRQTYNYWEKGISVPCEKYLSRLTEVVGAKPEDILGYDAIYETKTSFFGDACREVVRRVNANTLSYRQEERILRLAKNIVSLVEADLASKHSADKARAISMFAVKEKELVDNADEGNSN